MWKVVHFDNNGTRTNYGVYKARTLKQWLGQFSNRPGVVTYSSCGDIIVRCHTGNLQCYRESTVAHYGI